MTAAPALHGCLLTGIFCTGVGIAVTCEIVHILWCAKFYRKWGEKYKIQTERLQKVEVWGKCLSGEALETQMNPPPKSSCGCVHLGS